MANVFGGSVAAVIGKGGEQIAAIQSESGCRVQFAPGLYFELYSLHLVCIYNC